MATTPLWVPLAVAGAGVLGTLSAVIFSQIWSAKREDQRWLRDREVEETRWQREQVERHEQWRHEDRARWLVERRNIYAEYLLGLDTWKAALAKAEGERRKNGHLADETITKLQDLEIEHDRTYENIRIIAPNDVIQKAASSSLGYKFWQEGILRPDKSESAKRRLEAEDIRRDDDKRLRNAIRSDLRIDNEA